MAKRLRPQPGRPDRKPQPAKLLRAQNNGAESGLAHVNRAVSSPPSALAPPREAVQHFELAMQALQRHRYDEAAEGFRVVIRQFPAERGLRDCSQVYLDLCERELARKPVTPTTVEECLTAATAALNNDDDKVAEVLARGVLDTVADHELAMYLLAAVAARRGLQDEALTWLSRAVAVSPEIRAQARHDADFLDLRELDAFRQLLDGAHEPAPSRPIRRGRAER